MMYDPPATLLRAWPVSEEVSSRPKFWDSMLWSVTHAWNRAWVEVNETHSAYGESKIEYVNLGLRLGAKGADGTLSYIKKGTSARVYPADTAERERLNWSQYRHRTPAFPHLHTQLRLSS